MKLLNPKKILVLSLLIGFLLLLIIPTMRFFSHDSILPGTQAYHHIRMAKHIKEEGIPIEYPLIRLPYLFQPYDLILALVSAVLGSYVASIILPLVSGLISIVFFYFILKHLRIDDLRFSAILLLFVLSPLYIFLFGTSNQHGIAVALILMGSLFFIKGKNFFLPGLLVFGIIPFFGVLPAFISIFAVWIFFCRYSRNKRDFSFTLSAIIISLFLSKLVFFFQHGLPQVSFNYSVILTNLVSDLGSPMGFGIFHLVLALFGLYVIWNMHKPVFVYFLLVFFILISFVFIQMNVYLHLISAVLGGIGFARIIRMKWKIDLIKTLTIVLIICGLLFSTLSYMNRVAQSSPDPAIVKSLEWLKDNSYPGEVVFSHYTKGDWIETISDRPAVLDNEMEYISSLNQRLYDSDELFYSRNLENTTILLELYNISYIWIDPEMKQGQVWTREDEGLLFLFRNKRFRNIYEKDGVEIWKIKRY